MMLLLFSFSGIICHGDCWNIRVCDLFVFQSPEVNIVGEEMGSQLQGSKIMLLVTWNYGSTHFLLSNMSVIIVVSILFVFFFLSNKLHKILKEHSRCHISQTSWFYVMLLSDLAKKTTGLISSGAKVLVHWPISVKAKQQCFWSVLFLMSRVLVLVSLQQGESASECYCLAVREGVSKMKVVNIGNLALQWRR